MKNDKRIFSEFFVLQQPLSTSKINPKNCELKNCKFKFKIQFKIQFN